MVLHVALRWTRHLNLAVHRTTLTPEEEAWVQRLVSDDEDGEGNENGVWANLTQYGFSPEEDARVKEIDELLKLYRDPAEWQGDVPAAKCGEGEDGDDDDDDNGDFIRQVSVCCVQRVCYCR
jgi:hypothetical protein